jgi:hypothetical protein
VESLEDRNLLSSQGILATPIALNSQVNGLLAPFGADYYAVTVQDANGVAAVDGQLTATVHANGFPTRLTLLDANGAAITQVGGQSPTNLDNQLVTYLRGAPKGGTTYLLEVSELGAGTGSYTLNTQFVTSLTPRTPLNVNLATPFVVGEFTGNGVSDLAVAQASSPTTKNGVRVFVGNGDGAFQPGKTTPLDGQPLFLALGNFAGHGNQDLAVVSRAHGGASATLNILLDNADGTFQVGPSLAIPHIVEALAEGDFTGNGTPELAVADNTDTVSIYQVNTDGSAVFVQSFSAPGVVLALSSVHVNGQSELVLVNGSNILKVYREDATGTFQTVDSFPLDGSFRFLTTGDFNGDGVTDLAAATPEQVAIFLGKSDGTFTAVKPIALSDVPTALAAGDFNGDGKDDLAIGENNSSDVAVLLSNGDGTFGAAQHLVVGSQPEELAAADFNGDGRLDLAVSMVTPGSNPASPFIISVFSGLGDGTFQNPVPLATGVGPAAVVRADFNGDGVPDLATVNQVSNDVSILFGNGDGTFQTQIRIPVGKSPSALVTGDFNNDGRADLAVLDSGGPDVMILLGIGDGTFREVQDIPFTAAENPDSLVVGDFYGDGIPDLAVADKGTGMVTILRGKGDGTFIREADFAAGKQPSSILVARFTKSGHDDLAVINPGGGSVLLGQGNGKFAPPKAFTLPGGGTPVALVAGAFDKGGDLDLAVATAQGAGGYVSGFGYSGFGGSGYGGTGYGYSGFGGSGFGGYAQVATPAKVSSISSSGTAPSGTITILRGNGDGTFVPGTPFQENDGAPTALATGYFDKSGDLGLAVANSSYYGYYYGNPGAVSVLLSDGHGNLSEPGSPLQLATTPQGILTSDVNADGLTDIVTVGLNAASVYLGQPDGTFTAAGTVSNPIHADPLLGNLTGSGRQDAVILDQAGNLLFRAARAEPGAFDSPVVINPSMPVRDATLVHGPNGDRIAALAAHGDAVELFTYQPNDTFTVTTLSLPAGSMPIRVASADLNGDGWGDLVVLNAGTDTVSVFLAQPDGSFKDSADITAPPGASGLTLANLGGGSLPDILVTSQVTGQVSLIHNLGDGTYGTGAPFPVGAGPYDVEAGNGQATAFSQEGTSTVAVADLIGDGTADVVAVNTAANTFSVLLGQGDGALMNPRIFQTGSQPIAVAIGDFNGDGIPDIAILDKNSVEIWTGDGLGGFKRTFTADAGNAPTGLTIQKVKLANGQTRLDLLVGNKFGDILRLEGDGHGKFAAFQRVDQSIALAVTPQNTFVFGNKAQDQVAVKTASNQVVFSQDRSNGIQAPGAVAVVNIGDGMQALIVANSGANSVLVYLGSGGQFDPSSLQTYFAGTDPVGLTVQDLNGDGVPDVIVANKGSNDVSVLLGQGIGANFTLTYGPRLKVGSGPVATAVDTIGGQQYLAVTNSGSNTVWLLPGRGNGFFSDQPQDVIKLATGVDPVQALLFTDPGTGPELATINAGSGSLTLYTNLFGATPIRTDLITGDTPVAAVAGDFTGDGRTDLLVANNGDGRFDLFLSGADGFTTSAFSVSGLDHPTALAFSPLGDVVFGAEEGQEEAFPVLVMRGPGPGLAPEPQPILPFLLAAPPGSSSETTVASAAPQLLPLQDSSLAVVATLLTADVTTRLESLTSPTAAVADEAAVTLTTNGGGDDGETVVRETTPSPEAEESRKLIHFVVGVADRTSEQPLTATAATAMEIGRHLLNGASLDPWPAVVSGYLDTAALSQLADDSRMQEAIQDLVNELLQPMMPAPRPEPAIPPRIQPGPKDAEAKPPQPKQLPAAQERAAAGPQVSATGPAAGLLERLWEGQARAWTGPVAATLFALGLVPPWARFGKNQDEESPSSF